MSVYSSYSLFRKALMEGRTTCEEAVTHFLEAIEQGKHLHAFIEVFEEEAVARAKAIDEKVKRGEAGRLAGMVVGLKDIICYEGHKAQAGSKVLDGFVSPYSATAVERMLAEDAIIIGRQNCDEFGMGSSTENPHFGATRNPYDPFCVAGGSSGGSAAAVAANMCHVALGSDTGGSVRQPAAFCGVLGLKPTYSRISRHGLIAYASSFDTIGLLGKDIHDLALVLEIIAGADAYDATVSQLPVPQYTAHIEKKPATTYRFGYLKEALESKGLQPEVKKAFEATLQRLREDGHTVSEIQFPLLEYILPTYYILTTAEASTNFSRFDGVRYGYRTIHAKDLESMYKKTRSEGFGPEVRRRIMLGTFVLSASYYDAYFTKAQKVRHLITQQTRALFGQYDFVLSPTSPSTAFEIGKMHEKNIIELYLADLFTVQASVAGLPAISVPVGKDAHNLPIGIQLMGDAFSEGLLFEVSSHIQGLFM